MSSSRNQVAVFPNPFAWAQALWIRRSLLWQFVQRNVELRHKGSHLGLVWSVLNPLLMLALYVFVFGYILKGKFGSIPNETSVDYALGVFLGLAIFHFLAEVLSTAPTIIVSSPNLVKKVVFPLEVLPAAGVGASLVHLLISLLLVLAGILILGPGIGANAVWAPLIFLPLIPLALGIGWLVSAVGVFFRDVGQIVGVLILGIMFSSGIFYPASSIPPAAWSVLRFNPVLLTVELSRNSLLWNHPINLTHLAYVAGVSLALCVFGYTVFRRTAPAFADVL